MPLAEAAYTQLRNMILTGELPPDSGITENSIVDRLTIGKTPVREAMRRLVLEGLLDVTPRLGYTVVGISGQDVEDLFRLLMIVEVAAAQSAIERLDEEALGRLEDLSNVGYDPEDRESITRFVALNTEFHALIAAACGNRRLEDLIGRLMTESQRFFQIANLSDDHGRAVMEQHKAIVAALRSGDHDAVAAAVHEHLSHTCSLVLESMHAERAGD